MQRGICSGSPTAAAEIRRSALRLVVIKVRHPFSSPAQSQPAAIHGLSTLCRGMYI
jgi:hypothetical protein